MDINATLFVQMIVFAAFVWFTMRFVWPPLSKALEERRQKIADGLSAAEKGRRELELAHHRVEEEIRHAKMQAGEVIEKANRRAVQIVEEAKEQARQESAREAKRAREQLMQEVNSARESLRQQVAGLAIAGAEKILGKKLDEQSNAAIVDTVIEEI